MKSIVYKVAYNGVVVSQWSAASGGSKCDKTKTECAKSVQSHWILMPQNEREREEEKQCHL